MAHQTKNIITIPAATIKKIPVEVTLYRVNIATNLRCYMSVQMYSVVKFSNALKTSRLVNACNNFYHLLEISIISCEFLSSLGNPLRMNFTFLIYSAYRGANIEAKDNNNLTPLLLAAGRGHCEIIELLLDKRANISAVDKIYERNAIVWAAEKGMNNALKVPYNP